MGGRRENDAKRCRKEMGTIACLYVPPGRVRGSVGHFA